MNANKKSSTKRGARPADKPKRKRLAGRGDPRGPAAFGAAGLLRRKEVRAGAKRGGAEADRDRHGCHGDAAPRFDAHAGAHAGDPHLCGEYKHRQISQIDLRLRR